MADLTMTPTEYAAASARKTALRVTTLCAAGGGLIFVLVSTDPYFARFEPLSLWLARAGAVLASGLAFFFGASYDNCPACARPRGLGLVLKFFMEAAISDNQGPRDQLRYKLCDLEKAAGDS